MAARQSAEHFCCFRGGARDWRLTPAKAAAQPKVPVNARAREFRATRSNDVVGYHVFPAHHHGVAGDCIWRASPHGRAAGGGALLLLPRGRPNLASCTARAVAQPSVHLNARARELSRLSLPPGCKLPHAPCAPSRRDKRPHLTSHDLPPPNCGSEKHVVWRDAALYATGSGARGRRPWLTSPAHAPGWDGAPAHAGPRVAAPADGA